MKENGYRFSQRVDNYVRYRPRYPEAVLDLLKAECGLTAVHAIADVGSGTGILSELFLKNGNPVFGVEPDPEMRAGAEHYLRRYPAFTSIPGTAEATTLPDHGVDFVAAGQAFHWFDVHQARKEFLRILAPDGWVALVWNVQRPAGTPFLVDLQAFWQTEAFWKPPSSRPSSLQSSAQEERAQRYRLNATLAREELLVPFFGPGAFFEASFENPLVCNFRQLKGRVLSNAPALEPEDANYATMVAALAEIFHAHQKEGTVTIEHDTRVVYGRLTSTP